jgi:hypothetical protein
MPVSFLTAEQRDSYVLRDSNEIDVRAYTFCVLGELHTALRRREVLVTPSWRYADPRAGLLTGTEWDAARPIICRTLGLSPDPHTWPKPPGSASRLVRTSISRATWVEVHALSCHAHYSCGSPHPRGLNHLGAGHPQRGLTNHDDAPDAEQPW